MSKFTDIAGVSVGTLVRDKQNLVEVKSSTSIYNTLRIMDQYKVISVPLYEAPQSNTPGKSKNLTVNIDNRALVGLIAGGREFVAYVSITDILAYVLRQSTLENVQEVLDTRILDVVGATNETLIHSVESDVEPIRVIMEKMTEGI